MAEEQQELPAPSGQTAMAHNFCCAHPQQRIDTPEPPSRPPLKIDGLLAAAALPEGHPHALKFPDKKPGLDSSISGAPTSPTSSNGSSGGNLRRRSGVKRNMIWMLNRSRPRRW
ncbi:hypothetical protein LTR75_014010 [Friedmanniomyces endolithicus]|nr:hypothetical protein LTR75_014010 [Friedmanniomyces endolithicus]